MPSPIGSFSQGLLTGRAKAQAKKQAQAQAQAEADKARLAQFNKDRTHDLNTIKNDQTVRGAWEDEVARLDAMINDDANWSPGKTMQVMAKAKVLDDNYSPVMGDFSAQRHFANALNLGSQMDSGKQGPPGPNDGSPIAGFTSKKQKNKYIENEKTVETKAMLGEIEQRVGAAMLQYATDEDGGLDPRIASQQFFKIRADIMGELGPNADYEQLDKMFDNMMATIAPALLERAKLYTSPEEVQENMDKTSKDISYWIKSRYGQDVGLGNFQYFSTGTAPGMNMVERAGQRLAQMGLDTVAIKVQLDQRFVKDGKWPGNNKAAANDIALSNSPPIFANWVQAQFDSGAVDPRDVEVVWDPDGKGAGGLLDLATAGWAVEPFMGDRSPVTWGDTPTPEDGPQLKAAEPEAQAEEPQAAEEPKETVLKTKEGTLKMDIGSSNAQVKAFFQALADLDKRARGKDPETKARLAEEARKLREENKELLARSGR